MKQKAPPSQHSRLNASNRCQIMGRAVALKKNLWGLDLRLRELDVTFTSPTFPTPPCPCPCPFPSSSSYSSLLRFLSYTHINTGSTTCDVSDSGDGTPVWHAAAVVVVVVAPRGQQVGRQPGRPHHHLPCPLPSPDQYTMPTAATHIPTTNRYH